MPADKIPCDQNDLEIMAKTVWGEARGETEEGRTAVAWTIRNRAQTHGWAGTLMGQVGAVAHVCLQPWQFSCWLESDPNRSKIDALTLDQYAGEYGLAVDVLRGVVPDPTHGATNYYEPTIAPPYWVDRMTYCGRFGTQLFYK